MLRFHHLHQLNDFHFLFHPIQYFSRIFHFSQINFFVVLYSIVLYWKYYKISYMYWENPIHKNIVNPIPIPNTIAQAWSRVQTGPFSLGQFSVPTTLVSRQQGLPWKSRKSLLLRRWYWVYNILVYWVFPIHVAYFVIFPIQYNTIQYYKKLI